MLSCEVQLSRLGAGNFDHWLPSCWRAFCSSLMQLLMDWSTERPAVAAASSLQLRAMSNFGTVSATVTNSCELNAIIEIDIAMFSPSSCLVRRYRHEIFRTSILPRHGGGRLCENGPEEIQSSVCPRRPTAVEHQEGFDFLGHATTQQ